MESLYEAGIVGKGISGFINYKTEVTEPEEFQENYLVNITHSAGFLINGQIPNDLNILPVKAKPAINKKIKKEKL